MKLKQKVAAILLLALPLRAQVVETFNFSPHLAIPDGNATGVSDAHTVTSSITSISSLDVTLNITSEFNGDLYLYLQHDTGVSVLLNRAGRQTGNSFGYADSGFDITLKNSAASDVHVYRTISTPATGQKLTGEWQPDGRLADPSSVRTSDSRTARLDAFQGLNPNGQWTLFAADLSNGALSQLESWGLVVTAVPEPQHIALASAGALAAFTLWRRTQRG